MTSQKQIEANRDNAKKSTGPNTTEGKSKSRLNAIRDNITGQITTLTDADRAVFEKLKAEHVASLAPQTISELKLAHAIAWDTWRLDRLRAAEMNIFALAAENPDLAEVEEETDQELQSATSDANVYLTQARRLELTSLYEQRMNRSLHRNRAELHDLQTARRRNYETDRKEEILLARFEDLKDKAYQAPTIPSRNGSVFSSDEISLAAERQRNLEAAQYLLNNKAPWVKYGSTGSGSPDLFAELPYRIPPDCIPPKIHGVSPESIAIRKFYYPEEFEKKRR
jgi:primosomal protein N'